MKLNRIAASALTAATLLLATGSASAGLVNVGGVVWDTDSFFDFSANSTLVESVATTAGQTISGYGLITTINTQTNFCSGCELTYTFTGYTLVNSLTPAVGESFTFTGGVLNFFVSGANANFQDVTTFSDGTPWLTLVGADPLGTGATLAGSLTGVSSLGAILTGEGSGFLNVAGGLAAAYFDTNSQFGADFKYTSEFQPLPSPIGGITHLGTATIAGDSQPVPEPGVIALLGLGLAGLGVSRRMKKAA
ncbi:PEP-CTERM sorting domain-containing protein [Hydrogenophaga sp. PBL-H3]|uniref:PEP-CTERM sorting domain-containing protein n=1 Tax=Hydrogenophaga sp. PBL-H3 TaxID=434010 RepID=UPI00131FB071|nr:PEP-CTERM sorting domain-containing protein [Hydrogenophaga sp. PBL-H3]QHE76696.1 PEP-CTERM sorting domain-containing protein [Hydrogenophaga sp. PBL-H3]QHE81120.1 PEP-CTERM sorting domain-containing protein [Hydrogenophaga sp. PBL-H3]